jgi:TatD DNase family protein
MYVDSHCHLDDSQFDSDRHEVIARAREAGVSYLLVIGGASGPDDLDSGLRIAALGGAFAEPASGNQREPLQHTQITAAESTWIYAAGGMHPHEACRAEERHFEGLRRIACKPKFVAIGEIGLDYHYDHSPRELQKQVFIRQLEIAREAGLPIIVHCREAWADLRVIIKQHWPSAPPAYKRDVSGILHCFSGTSDDASELMDLGFMVSFAGNITFKKADELRAIAASIPLGRLLTETDCPYLAPVPYRGKRNEPAYVCEVTRQLAAIHRVSEEEMGNRMVQNFRRVFALDTPPPDR